MADYQKTPWYPKGDPKQTEITDERMNNLEKQYDMAKQYIDQQINTIRGDSSKTLSAEVRTSAKVSPKIGDIWYENF